MTGLSGYASLMEAWGTSDLSEKIKKDGRKKKQVQDAVCDLLNTTSSYDDTDLVKFANSYYDKTGFQRTMKNLQSTYEETQRQLSPKQVIINDENIQTENALFESQFENNLPILYDKPKQKKNQFSTDSENISNNGCNTGNETLNSETLNNDSDNDNDNDNDFYEENLEKYYNINKFKRNNKKHRNYRDNSLEYFENYSKYNSNLNILDLILYVISGIILIFLMEQFVKIGINLQSV